MSNLIYQSQLPGGSHWSLRIPKGTLLRLTDIEGGANLGMLFYNPLNLLERYNAPDTLKCQHTFKLTAGHCLYSDMGRVLAAITADTCGWHDSMGGLLNAAEVAEKYGQGRYQELRNGFFRNGMDNLLVELGKWDLGLADLLMNLNLFSKVTVDGEGALQFEAGNSRAGDYIELYAPMDTLVVLTALQHPLDPNPVYSPRPVQLSWHRVDSDGISVLCRTSRPENARGFHNTERLYI